MCLYPRASYPENCSGEKIIASFIDNLGSVYKSTEAISLSRYPPLKESKPIIVRLTNSLRE